MDIARQSINQRIEALKSERSKGLQQLAGLQQKQEEIRQTLLRIEGAMQVLDELLSQDRSESDPRPKVAAVQ
jgi:hypothetical protein